MKKLLGFFIAIFVMSIALPVFAAEDIPVHMNVRFWNRDDKTQEARWSLHAVEITAMKEEQNIGGLVTYRIADQLGVNGLNANNNSFPVEAKVYIKGGAHKLTTGLMFVPFAIYKWNNLYIPTLDVPGKRGHIWDADWGMLYTYDAKPILLDIGYFDNSGEKMSNEQTEKNTITARLGYDAFSNWNIGASFLNGKVDALGGTNSTTTKTQWALDTTWAPFSVLTLQAEYVDYDFNANQVAKVDGNFGLLQAKYDITKVPAPLDKISLVLQYSWDDTKNVNKEKNYQEEIWFKVAKNLDIFWQNVQDKNTPAGGAGVTTKNSYLAFKYNIF